MVEQVEHFRTEIKASILPRESKALDDRKVRVDEVRTMTGVRLAFAEFAGARRAKAIDVKPFAEVLVESARRATSLVGANQAVAVFLKIDARTVVPIHDKYGEPRN